MPSDRRHHLHLIVDTPGAVLARVYPNGKLGGLTLDHQPPGALGEFVTVAVRSRRPPREFVVDGQIAWARRKGSPQLGECFGVDFLADDEASVNRLLAFARDEVPAETTRLERRVQVELPIKLVHGKRSRRERLADLSLGGAFVRTWDPIPVDELVELTVRPPNSIFSLNLKARVAWIRRVGDAAGMGLEFLDLDGSVRREIDKVLARLR